MIPYHATAGEVVAAAVPRAGGNAGSTASMRSITLQGFSVPMEAEDEDEHR